MTANARKEFEHDDVVKPEADAAATPEANSEAPVADAEELPPGIPSWFSRTYPKLSAEDIASRYRDAQEAVPAAPVVAPGPEAYEAYKRRLEERFQLAQRLADPQHATPQAAAPVRTAVPPPPRPVAQRVPHGAFPTRGRAAAAPATAPKGRSVARTATTALVLAVIASAAGGTGGYLMANPGGTKAITQASMTGMGAILSWFGGKAVATETVIEKKPVRMAKLDVNDVAGPLNGPIPLAITAFPADNTPISLKISGLPPDAYITMGHEVGVGQWMLKPADVTRAQLVIPRSTAPELGLEVAALEDRTGDPVAPVKSMRVALDLAAVPVPGVQPPPPAPARQVATLPAAVAPLPTIEPASTVPDQGYNKVDGPIAANVPAPMESLNPEVASLLAKGESLLKSGDIIAARQFYLKAYGLKAAEGALGVGKTYDPATFASLNVQGLKPDAAKAAEWYGKAAAQGLNEASDAMHNLPTATP